MDCAGVPSGLDVVNSVSIACKQFNLSATVIRLEQSDCPMTNDVKSRDVMVVRVSFMMIWFQLVTPPSAKRIVKCSIALQTGLLVGTNPPLTFDCSTLECC